MRPKTRSGLTPAGTMNTTALADYLGLTRQGVARWLERDPDLAGLARVMPNGRKVWLRDEVDAWIRNRCFALGGTDQEGAA